MPRIIGFSSLSRAFFMVKGLPGVLLISAETRREQRRERQERIGDRRY